MERSWLDDNKTDRIYRSTSNRSIFYRVVNEYQSVKCPTCSEHFFCRLTHIYESDIQNLVFKEYHTNYKRTIEELQKLRVGGDDTFSLYEKNINGDWLLFKDQSIIAKEVN